MPDGYLDAASTEPLHPSAAAVLPGALAEGWADPQRLYHRARRSRLLLDNAREVVAAAIGARPDEVVFPASGTQALHLAIQGMTTTPHPRRGVVASAVEHSAVLQAARKYAPGGVQPTLVGVDREGRVDAQSFAAAARGSALACLQVGNHEVGSTQPVAAVVDAMLGDPEHPDLLVDAAAAVGRVPIPEGWDLLAASAHKWGGPPGLGVLAIRRGTRYRSPVPLDERGWGLVPGYENVPAAVAAATALRARLEDAAEVNSRHDRLVRLIRDVVPKTVPDVQVVGHPEHRLPHIVTFSCLYVEGEALLGELDRAGFAVSSGSSCTSSTLRPSHVLEAMGVLTHGNVRVSLARDTTEHEVRRFLEVLPDVVARVRGILGVTDL